MAGLEVVRLQVDGGVSAAVPEERRAAALLRVRCLQGDGAAAVRTGPGPLCERPASLIRRDAPRNARDTRGLSLFLSLLHLLSVLVILFIYLQVPLSDFKYLHKI